MTPMFGRRYQAFYLSAIIAERKTQGNLIGRTGMRGWASIASFGFGHLAPRRRSPPSGGAFASSLSTPLHSQHMTPSRQSFALVSRRTCKLFSTSNVESDNNNPTQEWRTHLSSSFVCHILVPSGDSDGAPITVEATVSQALKERNSANKDDVVEYKAQDLISLGAVWFLSADAPRDPAKGVKIRRLSSDEATMPLSAGDYLRVHVDPRRFPMVYRYDWNARYIEKEPLHEGNDTDSDIPESKLTKETQKIGIIVGEDPGKGWLVINKPSHVPVHKTVDNGIENAQTCLYQARTAQDATLSKDVIATLGEDVYVHPTHRLDQNTSGLLVVATAKVFAAYYSALLRTKTEKRLDSKGGHIHSDSPGDRHEGIHKLYKCLVCLLPTNSTDLYVQEQERLVGNETIMSNATTPWSVVKAMQFLTDSRNKVIRHWLEPTIRAPKRFWNKVPCPDTNTEGRTKNTASWLESLLKITYVGKPCALVGNAKGEDLAAQLWGDVDKKDNFSFSNGETSVHAMPEACQAVVELHIELLTGRTHQIRGQLSALGFPLVGDVQYGGAVERKRKVQADGSVKSPIPFRLALQCHQLEFLDPDEVENDDGETKLIPSTRWNRFTLNHSWWSTFLHQYQTDSSNQEYLDQDATMNSDNEEWVSGASEKDTIGQEQKNKKRLRSEYLPDRVQLSPGKNKYVLVRAFASDEEEQEEYWFVKSATPRECGGPYHGNVAQDLREWIEAAGYDVEVTGGGRIDYDRDRNTCLVYGFSYGFGKGNHEFAVKIIREHTGILASFDNTDGIY